MLAVQVRHPGPLENHAIETLPDLVPGPGEVVVDIKAAAVNYPDLLVMTGRYQVTPPCPFAPGKEGAGIVRATGPDVKRVRPGDRVMIHVEHGTYATQAIAREDQCLPLPAEMGFVDAAAVGLAAQTAWFALLERGGFQPGDVVLVTGASGAVGHAAIQIVTALGGIALAAASNLERAKSVLEGVHCHFIDLVAPDLRNSLRQQVHEATGRRGVDIVIETLGGDVFDAALRTLAWSGRIVTVGFAAGRIPEVKANYLLVKNIAAFGLQWSDYRDRMPEKVARAHAGMVALWARHMLRSASVQTLPMAEFAQALSQIEKRQAGGRLVLTME
ncbi:MAG: NADPH:quinone oxidoreductase family protein [Burkholderiaceae bacterium]|nr:MAG: NADPH:quinone oxidoreductase family protein [Burkholderiaceae bacterium]